MSIIKKIYARGADFARVYDVWCILALAFIVRGIGMVWMDYANFPEFYRDYHMARGIATGQYFTLLGPPSMLGGFHFGPLYYYLMVPFTLLFHLHPLGLIFTGIIVSVLTVYVLFAVLLLWTGNRMLARLGGVFCALSVYSLHLASYTSNPNFLPLFVLWYFYCLTKILEGQARTREYMFLGVSFACATQLHVTALIVLPLVTLGCLAFYIPPTISWAPKQVGGSLFGGIKVKKGAKVNRATHYISVVFNYFCSFLLFSKGYTTKSKGFIISALAVILLYLPYLLYDALHHFSNLSRLLQLGGQSLRGGHVLLGVTALWNFFQGTVTPFNYAYGYATLTPSWLYVIVAALLGVLLVYVLYRMYVQQGQLLPGEVSMSRVGKLMLLFWFLSEAGTLLVYSRATHDHYLIVLWPLPVILVACATMWMHIRLRAGSVLVLCIVLISLLQMYSFYEREQHSWKDFPSIYRQNYQNEPNISEIGSGN